MRDVLIVALVVWSGVIWIALRLERRRRRRYHEQRPVSPAWLNENVYNKEGDRRWK